MKCISLLMLTLWYFVGAARELPLRKMLKSICSDEGTFAAKGVVCTQKQTFLF
jgi:hypothetical protein